MYNYEINSLSTRTCLDTCEGVCKRVLKDIKDLSDDKMLEEYINDKLSGGRDYSSIIQLGLLLNKLEEESKDKIKDILEDVFNPY